MKFKFKKRYVVIIIIVVIILSFVMLMLKGPPLIQVETVLAEKGDIESIVSAGGIVEGNITRELYASAPVKVKKIYIEENDVVSTGQKIIDFDLTDLQSNLSQLKINKHIQELNYRKLSSSNEEGMLSIVQTENLLDKAKQNYENSVSLYELGAISKLELENAERAYEEAKAGLGLAVIGSNADIEILQKQIELTQIQINDLEKKIQELKDIMVSPISGVISELNAVQGGTVSSGVPVYEVVDNSAFEITANVKEFTAKSIKAGQKVYITGDAFDGITYTGYIKSISPIAKKDMGNQTFIEVIVGVEDKETLLADGLNVTCDIVVDRREDSLSIPLSAFMSDKDNNIYVYEISDNTLKQVFIEAGINSDDKLEVVSGIEEGKTIVNNIGTTYKDGMKVAIKE